METIVQNYETLSLLTSKLRAAAELGEWTQMARLEQLCQQHVAAMQTMNLEAPLTEAARLRKMELIRKILADDAEIRNHIDPWMAQAQRSLARAARPRQLEQVACHSQG